MDCDDSLESTIFIPEELVMHILDFVSEDGSILKCRLVCKKWCDLIDQDLWRRKFKQRKPNTFPVLKSSAEMKFVRQTPWFVLFKMYSGSLFGRNFVKNNCGQDGLKYWKAIKDEMDWIVEKCEDVDESPPTKDVDNDLHYFTSPNSCFFLSQIIELPSHGLSGFILETMTAKITVSIWMTCVATRSYFFVLDATIRNWEHRELTRKTTIIYGTSGDVVTWTEMTLDFDQWYSGTKYIELIHGGYVLTGDMKITGAAVKLRIPNYHVSVVDYTPDSGIFHHRRRHLTSVPWQKSSDSELYKPYKLFGAKSKYKPDISQKFPWFICRDIVKLRPFTRNMLTLGNLFRNTFGYVDLFHNPLLYSKNEKMLDGEWYLRLSNTRSKRKTEEMPFFDLFQKICLRKRGLPDCIMDNFQPRFIAYNESLKYYNRGTNFELIVKLLDDNEKVIHEKKVSEIVMSPDQKPLVTLEKYGKGVRYVIFNTRGYVTELRIVALRQCYVRCELSVPSSSQIPDVDSDCELSVPSSSQRPDVISKNSGAKKRKLTKVEN